MNKIMKFPKVSVIIPCFHTEKYIDRCMESIIGNTYRELEIICVNDASGEKMKRKLEKYKNLDSRVVIVENSRNIGLYHSRLAGSRQATGEYICFVDSDDYVEKDYFRRLVFRAKETNADIVFSNICHVNKSDYRIFTDFNQDMMFPDESSDFFNTFISSRGKYFRWHVIWDKLIKRNVWDEAFSEFEKISERFMMCEDVVFSTGLLAKSKSISFADDIYYFYCDNSNSATSTRNISKERIKKNIDDIVIAFDRANRILDNWGLGRHEEMRCWRNSYITQWLKTANDISRHSYLEIRGHVKSVIGDYKKEDLDVFGSSAIHVAPYNNKVQKIVEDIIKHEVISFDVFDTLILRPFYHPTDLFTVINDDFNRIVHSIGVMTFDKVRVDAEKMCREELVNDSIDDITLDEIYDKIAKLHKIPKTTINKIKEKEIGLEIKYCRQRKFANNLYDLAMYLNKKIAITSDMYLPKNIIERILSKNGYVNYDVILVSSDKRKSKIRGGLYDVLAARFKGKTICHIDDSVDNCEVAKEHKITPIYLPKTIDAFNEYYGAIPSSFCDYSHDNRVYLDTTGVRTSLAIVANKMFDNPFKPRDVFSNFNNSPYELGYFALGMNLLALSFWMLEDSRKRSLDTLAFLSRDGYLPYKAANIVNDKVAIAPDLKIKYVYTSRRATMPILLRDGVDFFSVVTYLNWQWITPRGVLDKLSNVLKLDEVDESTFRQDFGKGLDDNFTTYDEFLIFLECVKERLYSKEKYDDYFNIAKEYYAEELSGKVGIFDIGYSAKPELIFSFMLQKNFVTYFIHANSSEAYERTHVSNNELELFYGFKPTITGILREIVYSSTEASCKG